MGAGWPLLLAAAVAAGGCHRVFGADVPDAADALVIPGLLAHYPFEALAVQELADVAGGYTARCAIAECPSIVPGKVGGAAQFSGGHGAVIATPPPALTVPGAFTVALWLRRDGGMSIVECPVSKLTQGSGNTWQLCLRPASVVMLTQTGELEVAGIPVGDWRHVAMFWDGETAGIALDGSIAGTAVLDPSAVDEAPIMIGVDIDPVGPVAPFSGAIDELRIYDRVLMSHELALLRTL